VFVALQLISSHLAFPFCVFQLALGPRTATSASMDPAAADTVADAMDIEPNERKAQASGQSTSPDQTTAAGVGNEPQCQQLLQQETGQPPQEPSEPLPPRQASPIHASSPLGFASSGAGSAFIAATSIHADGASSRHAASSPLPAANNSSLGNPALPAASSTFVSSTSSSSFTAPVHPSMIAAMQTQLAALRARKQQAETQLRHLHQSVTQEAQLRMLILALRPLSGLNAACVDVAVVWCLHACQAEAT
jgi:hypothetical protein